MMNSYFFDSYAIIESMKANPNYERFASETMSTTVMNYAEVYYHLLNEVGEKVAALTMEKLNMQYLEITPEIAREASLFRHKHKKKKLSYVDCLGYVLALKNNLLFLTGDNGFRDISNVEFVK